MTIEFSGEDTGEPIMVDEVEKALEKVPNGKASGSAIVTADLCKLLEDNGVASLSKLFNERYDSRTVPQEIMDSTLIPIPKKVRAFDCGNFQTISLMRKQKHTLKILFKVLLTRIKPVLHNEINECHYGFMPNKGNRNAIFILHMLSECCIEVNRDACSCFLRLNESFRQSPTEHLV